MLGRAMDTLGLPRATVISAYERKTLKAPRGEIEVVPAWDWLRGHAVSAMRTRGWKGYSPS